MSSLFEPLSLRGATLPNRVAIAREALFDPNWTHHAAMELGVDTSFGQWPEQSGWWLQHRKRALQGA